MERLFYTCSPRILTLDVQAQATPGWHLILRASVSFAERVLSLQLLALMMPRSVFVCLSSTKRLQILASVQVYPQSARVPVFARSDHIACPGAGSPDSS